MANIEDTVELIGLDDIYFPLTLIIVNRWLTKNAYSHSPFLQTQVTLNSEKIANASGA